MPLSFSHTQNLRAQDAAEDQCLLAKVIQIQEENKQYSCADDKETTPRLRHTRWLDWFQNRPLDMITAIAQKPDPRPFAGNEGVTLGRL